MIHPNIRFTYEAAENHQMPFLDVWIDNTEGIFKLSTYRKPTNTGLYINWQSFVPSRYQLNLVKTLLHRAYSICNSHSLIHQDFQSISSILKRNGYSLRYIDKQIRLFFNKRHEPTIIQKYDTSNNCESMKTLESKEIFLFLRLPYLGNISLQIEKEIPWYLIKNLSTKFRFRLVHDTHNIGKCFKFKDRQALLHNAGIVYKLNCSCGQSYIGQTHGNLATRIQEHVPNGKQNQESDVAKHLVPNHNHEINFDSLRILGHSNNRRKLRIKETLPIQKI